MVSGSDQSNELSMLDGSDGNVSPDFLEIFGGIDCTIRVFDYWGLGKLTVACLKCLELL